MGYPSLEASLIDLESQGQLLRIREACDPDLIMSAIHLLVHENQGPAILFEQVKGSPYRCSSNIFGTLARSEYLFRDALPAVQQLIALRRDPMQALKKPWSHIGSAWHAFHALPKKQPASQLKKFNRIRLSDLPQIKHWPEDGGAFVTLPQVYTEDPEHKGILKSNLGMYRIQLSGNEYLPEKEIGLHYQLHRGIGVHHSKAKERGEVLRVSCFTGGPPSHSVSAVMPLPEGISEMTFAGLLGQRRFRYTYSENYAVSLDADFIICGDVIPDQVKPEGPFGDHLGYYSLVHPFPVLQVRQVLAKPKAIWPFTVVGRPPQEDTSFGQLIHAMTGTAIQDEIPGLQEVHAVDAAGVHPLLLAIGSERYTPYLNEQRPAEILTIANHVLGTGQLSLAKFLYITADPERKISTHNVEDYLQFVFERIDLRRDIHFYTQTSIDTLDYSGDGLNTGSKVVMAAYGSQIRTLSMEVPSGLKAWKTKMVMPGVLAIQFPAYETPQKTIHEIQLLEDATALTDWKGFVQYILCDDAEFVAKEIKNYLWVTYTRCNPSHDIHGIQAFTVNKHWGCLGPLVLDARIKPHHAPVLQMPESVLETASSILKRAGYHF